MFDLKQARYLGKLKKLDRPLILTVSDDPQSQINSNLRQHLDYLSFIQFRYYTLPKFILMFVIKLISYRKNNVFVKFFSHLISKALLMDLKQYIPDVSKKEISKGLQFAWGHERANDENVDNPVSYDSGRGYDSPELDLAIAKRYKAWVDGSQHFETEEERLGTYFFFAIRNTIKFLKAHKEISRVINFGACYGIVEHSIAVECPHVHVLGVDRSPLIKDFNDNIFQARNLEYVASDIREFIKNFDDFSDSLFMFMRTAFIFPEDFMVDIFKLLAKREISAVAGIEPFGYSLSSKQFYEFTDEYKPSEEMRGGIIVHNYPYLAKIAKLDIFERKYFVPTKLEGDFTDTNRAFSFIATRR